VHLNHVTRDPDKHGCVYSVVCGVWTRYDADSCPHIFMQTPTIPDRKFCASKHHCLNHKCRPTVKQHGDRPLYSSRSILSSVCRSIRTPRPHFTTFSDIICIKLR